jgi:hypothetical protein
MLQLAEFIPIVLDHPNNDQSDQTATEGREATKLSVEALNTSLAIRQKITDCLVIRDYIDTRTGRTVGALHSWWNLKPYVEEPKPS